jgi:Ca2+-binding EF-hand superfamily protein
MNQTRYPSPSTITSMALATGLMLAVTGGAWASGMSGSSTMSNTPSNSGGKLTPAEQKTFSRLDANHDGKISQAEAKRDSTLAAKFSSVDKDGNNAVDEGEFARFEAQPQRK